MPTALKQYEDLLRAHAHEELPDPVLDQMDTLWFEMTEDERDRARLFSAQLRKESDEKPN